MPESLGINREGYWHCLESSHFGVGR